MNDKAERTDAFRIGPLLCCKIAQKMHKSIFLQKSDIMGKYIEKLQLNMDYLVVVKKK